MTKSIIKPKIKLIMSTNNHLLITLLYDHMRKARSMAWQEAKCHFKNKIFSISLKDYNEEHAKELTYNSNMISFIQGEEIFLIILLQISIVFVLFYIILRISYSFSPTYK